MNTLVIFVVSSLLIIYKIQLTHNDGDTTTAGETPRPVFDKKINTNTHSEATSEYQHMRGDLGLEWCALFVLWKSRALLANNGWRWWVEVNSRVKRIDKRVSIRYILGFVIFLSEIIDTPCVWYFRRGSMWVYKEKPPIMWCVSNHNYETKAEQKAKVYGKEANLCEKM